MQEKKDSVSYYWDNLVLMKIGILTQGQQNLCILTEGALASIIHLVHLKEQYSPYILKNR